MKLILTLIVFGGLAFGQAIVVNLETAQWTHGKGDAPGSEGVMVRADEKTGGIDLLVRYPAGHVIPAHFHDSNERIYVVEGRMTLKEDKGDTHIDAGGFAYLPAGGVQRMSCTSKSRCSFYLSWDGKPSSHAVK